METHAIKRWTRQVVTYCMMLVTVMLWGYLIGAFMQVHYSMNQATSGYASHLEEIPNLSMPSQSEEELNRPLRNVDELAALAREHSRFAQRNVEFEMRLKHDGEFLLKNSF